MGTFRWRERLDYWSLSLLLLRKQLLAQTMSVSFTTIYRSGREVDRYVGTSAVAGKKYSVDETPMKDERKVSLCQQL